MKRQLLFLVLLLCAASAIHAEFWDGNNLVRFMHEYEKAMRDTSDAKYHEATTFAGYVIGVHDSHETEVCTPANASAGQIFAVVAKYLSAHPEIWDQPASRLVLRALKEAFPCQTSPQK